LTALAPYIRHSPPTTERQPRADQRALCRLGGRRAEAERESVLTYLRQTEVGRGEANARKGACAGPAKWAAPSQESRRDWQTAARARREGGQDRSGIVEQQREEQEHHSQNGSARALHVALAGGEHGTRGAVDTHMTGGAGRRRRGRVGRGAPSGSDSKRNIGTRSIDAPPPTPPAASVACAARPSPLSRA